MTNLFYWNFSAPG